MGFDRKCIGKWEAFASLVRCYILDLKDPPIPPSGRFLDPVRTVLSGAFFGHSGEIVPSESFDVTLAAVRVQVPILEGRKFRVWNVLKIMQVLPGAFMP